MAFRGVTFASQNVTPKNDRGLYMAHHGDGILWGCEMSISGDELVVQSGELIAGGSVVQVDGATPVNLSGRTIQTGYIQVILNIDLTQGEGQQVYETFVESASMAFPDLIQEDIWSIGEIYQIELAVVQISGGNLTNINKVLAPSFLFGANAILRGNTGGVRVVNPAIEFFVNDRPVGRIASITGANDIRMYGENSDLSAGGGVVFAPDGVCILHGDGSQPIRFRPYGAYVNTNEVGVSLDGKIYGTFPKISASGNKAVTVNTVTDICSLTVTKGQWLIIGAFYGNSGSTGAIISYLRSTSLGNYKITRSTNISGGAATNGLIANFPNASETVTLAVYSPTAQTIQGFIYACRLE